MDDQDQEPAAIYVGRDVQNNVDVLVTVWPDGEAECATRPLNTGHAWGPPIPLERQTLARGVS